MSEQKHKKDFLKRDFPLAACTGWVKGTMSKQKTKPSIPVYEEGASRQKLLDLIMASPTSSLALKELAQEYITVREKYDEHMLTTMMDVTGYLKAVQEKGCEVDPEPYKFSEE